jgi:carbonic anhydrase
MDFYSTILENNKTWVAKNLENDPEYFEKLSHGQTPPLLWIGCADSRVPANEIIGAKPGEVFVHRNIANMVIHSDMNMLSVLAYAVDILQVSHIIVCGHYGCGGIQAALSHESHGIIDNWICHIRDAYHLHEDVFSDCHDERSHIDRLVEVNVREQVLSLAKTSIVQAAWSRGQEISLHGWAYGIDSGLVHDLDVTMIDTSTLPEIYRLRF